VHLTLVSSVIVVLTVWALAKGFGLDKGTAAGVLAGGATESAAIGTAGDALSRQPLPKEEIARMTSNIGVAYAVTYLFGTFTVIFFASSVAPKLLGIDLNRASHQYEDELGGGKSQLPRGQFEAIRGVVVRIHIAGPGCAGRSVQELEEQMAGVVIERIMRGDEFVAVEPSLKLQPGDRVAVTGRRRQVIQQVEAILGPESVDSDMNLIAELRDVVVTNRKLAGKTIGEIDAADTQVRRGAFLTALTRLEQAVPVAPHTVVAVGDVARIVGAPSDVERVSATIGYPVPPADKTDFLYFGLGLVSGFALGTFGVPFRGTSLGLGTGGGCLIAGLVFGWLRARRPTFGQLPAAAALYLKDFGLTVL
jgi:putative transport protein